MKLEIIQFTSANIWRAKRGPSNAAPRRAINPFLSLSFLKTRSDANVASPGTTAASQPMLFMQLPSKFLNPKTSDRNQASHRLDETDEATP